MTKKDYILIANVLKNKYEEVMKWDNFEARSLTLAYIEDFAKMLKQDNTKFNKDKFYKFINPEFIIG